MRMSGRFPSTAKTRSEVICPRCGRLDRRLRFDGRATSASVGGRSGGGGEDARWYCCGRPMLRLSYPQGEAAKRLKPIDRVSWLGVGGRILRTSNRWLPALTKWQLRQSQAP